MTSIPTLLPQYEIGQASFNWQDRLELYRYMARNYLPPLNEGLYFRAVYNPSEDITCIQIISYYRIQLWPFHINDYHPFYLYYDNNHTLSQILYDSGHHRSSLAQVHDSEPLRLTIKYPWHPFELGRKGAAGRLKANYIPLTDEILRSWWLKRGKPQLKLRSKLVDPWHPDLFPVDPGIPGSFRDEIICPECGERHFFDTLTLDKHGLVKPLNCCQVATSLARYDLETMQMEVVQQ